MLRDADIGGGTVRRTFRMGTEQVRMGRPLTEAEIMTMPVANRRALIDKGMIIVYPRTPVVPSGDGERHVVARGFGKYDVIEGHKLNDKPLTKDAARALAGVPAEH